MTFNYGGGDLEPRPHDGSHLTGRQARRVQRYVRQLLYALDLNAWRVLVSADLPPEGCALAVYPSEGRRLAMLAVSEGWYASTSAEEKRLQLTHEVLHLATHDVVEVIRRFKNENEDVGAYPMSIVYNQLVLAEERMVDSLAYTVGEFMPRWSESKKEPT